MTERTRRISVRHYHIIADDAFQSDFISAFITNSQDNSARMTNIRKKKYYINLTERIVLMKKEAYLLTVVRERNTWQVQAIRKAGISAIPLNQGIIGDTYFFLIVPNDKLILGFTTGPSGSLKSVARSVLSLFRKKRIIKLSLEPVRKSNDFDALRNLVGKTKLFFKVNLSSMDDSTDNTHWYIKQLQSISYLTEDSDIAITINDINEKGFTASDLTDIINHLSESAGCSALTVKGQDEEGAGVYLDFSKAYAKYTESLTLRDKYVSESLAKSLLVRALEAFDFTLLSDTGSPS